MATAPQIPARPPALLDVSPDETLDAWLAAHPAAYVGAVSPAGTPAPMPGSIVLGPRHETDDRSLLELVVPEDSKAVADAFIAALTRGVGVTRIHMASAPTQPLLLRYLDLRETHGVLLRFVVAGDTGEGAEQVLRASSLAPARPRLGVMTKDEVAKVLSIDTALSLMLGWAETEMAGHQNLEFIHPDDHVRAIDNWMSRVSTEAVSTVQTVRLRYLCKDGSWLWLETSNESRLDADGTTVVVARLFDVSEEMAAVEALRHRESFLQRLTDTVPVGLFHVAADGSVAFVNPVLRALIGDAETSTIAELADALLSGQGSLLHERVTQVMADGLDADLDVSLTEHDRRTRSACRVTLRAIADGRTVLGVLGCVVDVTELRSMADTDVLTGLQNRRSIMEALAADLTGHRGHVAAIYLDLDRFKPVNDRFGHHVGDQLLMAVAERLRERVRTTDQAGRHGGDEFLVVCPGVGDEAVAMDLARRMQRVFEDPFHLSGVTVAMTASVGVACGRPGVSADELVSCADRAMYAAKASRGGPPTYLEVASAASTA